MLHGTAKFQNRAISYIKAKKQRCNAGKFSRFKHFENCLCRVNLKGHASSKSVKISDEIRPYKILISLSTYKITSE